MNLKKELEKMRKAYEKKRLADIKLRRPDWLTEDDMLYQIFREKQELLAEGTVYYAHIVQANMMLFDRKYSIHDCPADILFSTDDAVNEAPAILKTLAGMLYGFKDKDPETVPEQWREMAEFVTCEHGRDEFTFNVPGPKGPAQMMLLPLMVFRAYIPEKTLTGSLVPILAAPGRCKSVMILPEQYWTGAFRRAWVKHQL